MTSTSGHSGVTDQITHLHETAKDLDKIYETVDLRTLDMRQWRTLILERWETNRVNPTVSCLLPERGAVNSLSCRNGAQSQRQRHLERTQQHIREKRDSESGPCVCRLVYASEDTTQVWGEIHERIRGQSAWYSKGQEYPQRQMRNIIHGALGRNLRKEWPQ